MAREADQIIAISVWARNEFGCPYCGFRSAHHNMSGGGSAVLTCGECEKSYIVLDDGITKSSIGLGEPPVYPRLQPHPRQGTPAHGRPDIRPGPKGEFFSSRGIGLDHTPGCFVCGGHKGLHGNIAAFVRCKAAGERVVTMFNNKGARLDYREHEPDRVQVKIGACKDHQKNLKELERLTQGGCDGQKNVITTEMIHQARNL